MELLGIDESPREGREIFVELGNDKAIEGFRDDAAENAEEVRYKKLLGQRITRIELPQHTSLQEAFVTVVDGVVPVHFQSQATPVWIETDSEGLKALLEDHYGLKGVSKPVGWGEVNEG